MRALRVIIGIFGVLVALFAGGCAAAMFGMMAFDPTQWQYIDAQNIGIVTMLGVLPAVAGAFVARWGFRKPEAAASEPPTGEHMEP